VLPLSGNTLSRALRDGISASIPCAFWLAELSIPKPEVRPNRKRRGKDTGKTSPTLRAFFGLLAAVLLPFLFSCAHSAPIRHDEEIPAPLPEETAPTAEAPAPKPDYLTLVAAGDNLYQEPILKEFFKGGKYNFETLYSPVKPYIEPAGIAFVNQETVLDTKGPAYSGYPLFNTPAEAGLALAAAGFDVVNHATNHVMDRGEAGIISSIDFWDTLPSLSYLGIYRSEEDREKRVCVIEQNNIRVGFLAYTTGTNYIPLAEKKSYMVSLADRDTMAAEIDALRPLCDYLAVSMHWGEEYQPKPSADQEDLARFLAEHSVDLVIGHHPHVLQPFARLPRPDGGETLCFYSLGNFIASHAQPENPALLGGLLYVRIKKTQTGTAAAETGLIPVISHYDADRKGHAVYPLSEYTEELLQKHGKRKEDPEIKLEYFTGLAQDMFGPALMTGNPFARNGLAQ
jgi:poly-gamma-glutamate synthesis protein (capsule biosynthesis protein)